MTHRELMEIGVCAVFGLMLCVVIAYTIWTIWGGGADDI